MTCMPLVKCIDTCGVVIPRQTGGIDLGVSNRFNATI